MYEKQGFYSGQPLKASQLDAMEDGIINAERLAMEGAAGAANMEKGTGASATQQLPDGVADGFDFTNKNPYATELDASLTGIIPYGATGDFASAFGGKCAAMGKRSHAEGTSTIAKGKYSHAEGDNSVALGDDSHTEGYQTVTGPEWTAQHAEGSNTQAIGHSSHAENESTIAKAANSHAGGWHSEVKSTHGFAHGAYLITNPNSVSQAVFGEYNLPTNSVFIVGDGTGPELENRKNMFEVRKNGDICMYYQGKMYSLQKIFVSLGKFVEACEIDLSGEVTE